MNLRELGAKALPTDLTAEREFSKGFTVRVQYCPEGRFLSEVNTAFTKASKGGRRKKVGQKEVAQKVLAKYVKGWRGLTYNVLIKEGILDPAKLRAAMNEEAKSVGAKKFTDADWEAHKAKELEYSQEDCAWLFAQSLDLEDFVINTMTDPEHYGFDEADDLKN